jgi:hypothetical protein
VARVESLRVAAVEALESRRELGDGRLDDEVVVVRHQAEGVEPPVVLPHDEAEEAEEDATVVVIPVDRDPSGSAGGDVEVAVGEDVAGDSRHRDQRTRPLPPRGRCGQIVTLSAQLGRAHSSQGRGLSPDVAAGDSDRAIQDLAGDCPPTWLLETAAWRFRTWPGTVPRRGCWRQRHGGSGRGWGLSPDMAVRGTSAGPGPRRWRAAV